MESCPQTVPEVRVTAVQQRGFCPHHLTVSVTKPITVEHVSAAPMLCNSKFHQLPKVVLWSRLNTVGHNETWPHSGNKKKILPKLSENGIYLKTRRTTTIIWEQYNIQYIMRHLWKYRTDWHCSFCSPLTWGYVRTTDKSHMEYVERLLEAQNRQLLS